MSKTTLLQCSDLHFGRDADLAQIAGLEGLTADLAPSAVAVAGDLTQRARHGEFQRALEFVQALRRLAPTIVVPGNHDVEWWTTPFDVIGAAAKYEKYTRYFGTELTPTLVVDGAVLCGVLTSYGVVAGSMTYNLNDMAVKGHLPARETERAANRFAEETPDLLRVLVMHQNLLRGNISRRMGLARWRAAWRQVMASGADLVLCGHDHEEAAGLLPNGAVVSTSSTHTSRTRGQRPSACNYIIADRDTITVRHYIWDASLALFQPGPEQCFPRPRSAAIAAAHV
ncbi:MAG: metallophosphoesterase [Gemmatimonadales bacterium]|nr:metallophosphoesterase [Gemmatimonadales bacterium]